MPGLDAPTSQPPPPLAWPDRSRVASSPGPGSPKELSPIVSEHTLQLDQFNVRKREEGETLCDENDQIRVIKSDDVIYIPR
ncbi:hypothetical protein GOODEAATRI_026972 [Goodea atripinnis]|uniref:Uncharacterized protein n=1 Tax=Goodea atripinnis TaxID=208336 RepID=A0ABV0PHC4_9TELE